MLVDDRQVAGEDGAITAEPLTSTDLEELTRIVREAVGFDQERGDSVSVSNVSFMAEEALPPLEEPGFLDSPTVRDVIRQGLWALLLIALGLGIIRPIVRSLSLGLTGPAAAGGGMPAAVGGRAARPMAAGAAAAAAAGPAQQPQAPLSFEDKINVARQLADRSPERVAQIVRGWVQSDD